MKRKWYGDLLLWMMNYFNSNTKCCVKAPVSITQFSEYIANRGCYFLDYPKMFLNKQKFEACECFYTCWHEGLQRPWFEYTTDHIRRYELLLYIILINPPEWGNIYLMECWEIRSFKTKENKELTTDFCSFSSFSVSLVFITVLFTKKKPNA